MDPDKLELESVGCVADVVVSCVVVSLGSVELEASQDLSFESSLDEEDGLLGPTDAGAEADDTFLILPSIAAF